MSVERKNPVDSNFFSEFFEQYKNLLFWTAQRLISDPYAVEDLVQQAVLQLLEHEPVLRDLNDKQRASYITSTVRNLAHYQLRQQSRHPISFLDEQEDLRCDAVAEWEEMQYQQEITAKFHQCWKQIDPQVRELLERKYLLQQSDEQIAQALGIRPQNVRVYVSRARKAVKKYLGSI